ncbi:VWA domain-containing protein [Corynebacterium riegelii]
MKRFWLAFITFISAIALAACGTDSGETGGVDSAPKRNQGAADLTIVAATELKDLEGLVQQAADDLGFSIELLFPGGTLDNSQALKRGDFDSNVDATWFATNRYVNLIGASNKLADETKTATSPVAFGVWDEAAARLGWDTQQPTWAEFAQAAEQGEFTFGMTTPSSSNSGFSALVSVATAVADTGQAISPGDLELVSPTLKALFQAQSLVSGSSGWLAEAFVADPERADAIVNYESTLLQMQQQGQPIQVVVPKDGVISADYPLSTLAQPSNPQAAEQVRALADWMLEHQEDIAQTFRRPVRQVDNLPEQLQNQQVIELPFPANQSVVDELLYAYNNQYRQPGTTTFVLDVSGSMEGARLESLKAIMHSLIDGSASTLTGDVSLRDREDVTLWSFSFDPNEPISVTFDRENPAVAAELGAYVDGLVAHGGTAIYPTLIRALEAADTSTGIPSIVLLSDGEATFGESFHEFREIYAQMSPEKRSIPVFVILYGDANKAEMTELAKLTGGEVFDALNGDLESAFKEIRGFQ